MGSTGYALGVELHDVQSKQELSWRASVEPVWVADKGGNERYVMQITLDVPEPVSSIQAKGTILRKSKDGSRSNRITLVTDSLRDTVRLSFERGETRDIQFKLKLDDSPVTETDCEPVGIRFKTASEQGAPPFYIAVKCVKKDEAVQVWVATPRSVKWLDTSIPEFFGKGKTTRGFEVNSNLALSDQGKAGEFVFGDGSKKYTYAILVETQGGERKTTAFSIRTGLMSINYTNSGNAASDVKPHVSVLMEARPFSEKIPFGVRLDASFASPGENFIKLSSISLYSGYGLGGSRFVFEPRLYFFMADGSSQKGNSFFTFLYFGTGFEMGFKMGKSLLNSELQLTSSGQNQLLGVNLEYLFNKVGAQGEAVPSWGVYAGMTQMQVQAKDLIKVSATLFGVVRSF